MNQIRLNSVLVLFVIANILNTIFPKAMGFEVNTGLEYQLSKYVYTLCILLMLPSLLSIRGYFFEYMRYMGFYVIIHIFFALALDFRFEIGEYLKTLMICTSFVFFEEILAKVKLNKYLLIAFILSVFINVSYIVFLQNRLEIALARGGMIGGGQSLANSLIYLLPLLFLIIKGKWASFLYILGFLVVVISLRRTALIAYIFCLPFIYNQYKRSVSKKYLIIAFLILGVIVWYVVTNYWNVMESRFSDAFEASESGTYGSGRTGWWMVLVKSFLNSPQYWLQGFGPGQVALCMAKAGYPYGSAHNDYLEIGYTFGIIGIVFWFRTIWKFYELSGKKYVQNVMLIRMATLSYFLVAMFSGAAHNVQFVSLAIFAALIVNSRKNRGLQL